MAEHGIFPPASLQSNDAPKVFSLTLTMAYKRDQFLPSGQHKEMGFFITEPRWGQKVRRQIREGKPWAPQTKMKPRYTRKQWAVLQNHSCGCPVATAQILWVLCGEQRAAVIFFFFCRSKISTAKRERLPVHSPCLRALCFSVTGHIWAYFLGNQRRIAVNAWKRLKGVKLSQPHTDRVCQSDPIWMLKINMSQNSKRKKVCSEWRVWMKLWRAKRLKTGNLATFHRNHHPRNKWMEFSVWQVATVDYQIWVKYWKIQVLFEVENLLESHWCVILSVTQQQQSQWI